MTQVRQATTLDIKLELYIKEPELHFLIRITQAMNLARPTQAHEATIQDVIRSLIRVRMRDEDAYDVPDEPA